MVKPKEAPEFNDQTSAPQLTQFEGKTISSEVISIEFHWPQLKPRYLNWFLLFRHYLIVLKFDGADSRKSEFRITLPRIFKKNVCEIKRANIEFKQQKHVENIVFLPSIIKYISHQAILFSRHMLHIKW